MIHGQGPLLGSHQAHPGGALQTGNKKDRACGKDRPAGLEPLPRHPDMDRAVSSIGLLGKSLILVLLGFGRNVACIPEIWSLWGYCSPS